MSLCLSKIFLTALCVTSGLFLACGAPESFTVTDQGVGPINALTPFDKIELEKILKDYLIVEGNSSARGATSPIFRVSDEEIGELFVLYPNADNTSVSLIVITSPSIHDTSGVSVGTTYDTIFGDQLVADAYPGIQHYTGHVLCHAPGSANITYVFQGDWTGPDGIIPPLNVLQSWTLKEISCQP
jgi:hypothetical protein